MRVSAGMPHCFLEAKPEGYGNSLNLLDGVEVKEMYRLSMWLTHGRYVLCLWEISQWMPKCEFLANFGLEREYLAFFFEKKSCTYLS